MTRTAKAGAISHPEPRTQHPEPLLQRARLPIADLPDFVLERGSPAGHMIKTRRGKQRANLLVRDLREPAAKKPAPGLRDASVLERSAVVRQTLHADAACRVIAPDVPVAPVVQILLVWPQI